MLNLIICTNKVYITLVTKSIYIILFIKLKSQSIHFINFRLTTQYNKNLIMSNKIYNISKANLLIYFKFNLIKILISTFSHPNFFTIHILITITINKFINLSYIQTTFLNIFLSFHCLTRFFSKYY